MLFMMPNRTQVLLRKFKYCAYDPNDGVYSDFSNSKAKVSCSIELPNKVLLRNGMKPMMVIECVKVFAQNV